MGKRKISDAPWYSTAVAISIGVIIYILLSQFTGIWEGIKVFIGYFKPLLLGIVIAYIVNPIAKIFNRLLQGIKQEEVRRHLSNGLGFVLVIVLMLFGIFTLLPQLIESMETLAKNLDGYIASVNALLESFGVSKTVIDLSVFINSSENVLAFISEYLSKNIGYILSITSNAGKGAFQLLIGFILAVYILAEKGKIKTGIKRLLLAIVGKKHFSEVSIFLTQCNSIFTRYIVFNLIDSLIVGSINMLFMSLVGMQYVGLISLVVAFTNLVPTFGPMIGMIIGGFVLLMVNPTHAIIFVIFSLILQIIDGYIIKPRLFGNSLGVSGLWILIAVIVGGNMFGILGILLSVPTIAILIFIYDTYIIPYLESRFDEGEGVN